MRLKINKSRNKSEANIYLRWREILDIGTNWTSYSFGPPWDLLVYLFLNKMDDTKVYALGLRQVKVRHCVQAVRKDTHNKWFKIWVFRWSWACSLPQFLQLSRKLYFLVSFCIYKQRMIKPFAQCCETERRVNEKVFSWK